jgi:hypothetical protein
MAITIITTAGFATSRHGSGVMARVTAAIAGAVARAKARHDYRRIVDNEDILRDVGISRDDVRQALDGIRGGL